MRGRKRNHGREKKKSWQENKNLWEEEKITPRKGQLG